MTQQRLSLAMVLLLVLPVACGPEEGASGKANASSSTNGGTDACIPGAECPAPPCQNELCRGPFESQQPEDQCVFGRIQCDEDGTARCGRTSERRVGLPCDDGGGVQGVCDDAGHCCVPNCSRCGMSDGCGSICTTGQCDEDSTCVDGECVPEATGPGGAGGGPTSTGAGGAGGEELRCTDMTHCLETPLVTDVQSPSPCEDIQVGFGAINTCDVPIRCAILGWEGTPQNPMGYADIELFAGEDRIAAVLWCTDALDQQGVTRRCAAVGEPTDCVDVFMD